jgi:hypothetical protein
MSYGQKEDKKTIGGVRGGWHSASLVDDGSKPDTAQSLSTFYVGFFRDNKVAKILFFGTGIEYFQNGMKYSNNDKRVLHTISIPVDLKVKIGPVFSLGGAAANFKMAERVFINDEKNKPADGDKSKGFDVAAFAGAGVKILFISIEARYHWGLLEVRNGMKSRYFQLGAAISF